MEFAGEFETHLTVCLAERQEQGIDALRDWATRHGIKCVYIVLERGQSASQPMLTRHGRGVLSAELAAASDVSPVLAGDGFAVSRIKVEAAPWNQGVPRSDEEAAGHPGDRHFEHHVKLLLDPDSDVPALAAVAQRHSAHVSRNALRVRDDRRHERFVTQRCYGAGLGTARRRLDALLAALAGGGYRVLEVEQEFVVYDSNAAVDAGWIER